MFNLNEQIQNKWAPVINHDALPEIKDPYKRAVTATLLENQEKALMEEKQALWETTPANALGGGFSGQVNGANANANLAGYDPILISLVRRAMPNLMAYDVCGVQPMTGPTGLIFAMKSNYSSQGSTEALFNEADTDFAGSSITAHAGSNPVSGTYTTGVGIATGDAEQLGDTYAFGEMAFSIEKTTVTAKTRALKAEYTVELAQDLKAVHGLDAEGELSNILSQEILFEINREVIRTIYAAAKPGADTGATTTYGTFDLDVDANGRWSVERFKGLLFQIERDANNIAQQTRRGKGNFIICSADVASALSMAGILDYTPALSTNLNVDDTGNTFAGVLNGKIRVYVDPYSANLNTANQFYVVGYKGTNPYDAGMFYCPYVPLQMVRAINPNTFQPKIGFKTRYGMVTNPFTSLSANSNSYYRRVKVTNLM
jgi:hypothetical protein